MQYKNAGVINITRFFNASMLHAHILYLLLEVNNASKFKILFFDIIT